MAHQRPAARAGSRRGVVLASVVTLLGAAVVAGVGLGASVLVSALVDDGMGALGVLVSGLLLTLLATTVSGVVLAVVMFRRALPAGDRLPPVLALLGVLLLGVVLSVLTGLPWLVLPALPLAVLAPLAATGRLRGGPAR